MGQELSPRTHSGTTARHEPGRATLLKCHSHSGSSAASFQFGTHPLHPALGSAKKHNVHSPLCSDTGTKAPAKERGLLGGWTRFTRRPAMAFLEEDAKIG